VAIRIIWGEQKMKLATYLLILVALFVFVLSTPPATADDTGFASIHALRKERGKICMVDHYHSGAGTGRTKRAARRAAIGDWQGFTAWEYGTDWGSFRSAASKGIAYEKVANGWSANVEARPCNRRRARK